MLQQCWRTVASSNGLKLAVENYRKYHTIEGIPRELAGTRMSARDRAQGRIPAVVLSSNSPVESEKQLITTERTQIQSILKTVGPDFFCTTIFELQVRAGSGSSHLIHSKNVLPIKLQRDENTGKVLIVVFLTAEEGSKLQVNVPIVFKGLDVCPGLKKGGQLNTIRKTLKFLCPTECIPQKSEVDVSNLDIGDQILLKDIQVDQSLKLLSKKDKKPICTVVASEVESLSPRESSPDIGILSPT